MNDTTNSCKFSSRIRFIILNHFAKINVVVTGEYVLVRVDRPEIKLDVQGRFEQTPRSRIGVVNATVLTSVVAASNNSIPIEVTIMYTYYSL